jgi:hypothetical protein
MNDMSQVSLAQLKVRKVELASRMDEMALELDRLNKEITTRFRCFKALCFAPGITVDTNRMLRRGAPGSDAQ